MKTIKLKMRVPNNYILLKKFWRNCKQFSYNLEKMLTENVNFMLTIVFFFLIMEDGSTRKCTSKKNKEI